MSRENVEVVRAVHEAWNRRELQSVLDRLHPDLQWEENVIVFPGMDQIYRGHDGFLKWDRDASEVWEWLRVESLEFMDAGDNTVAFVRAYGKGSDSGIEVELRVHVVYALRGGKITRRRIYTDRAEALEAAGLRK